MVSIRTCHSVKFPVRKSPKNETYQFVAQLSVHRGRAIGIVERIADALWRAIHGAPRSVLVSGWSADRQMEYSVYRPDYVYGVVERRIFCEIDEWKIKMIIQYPGS